MWQEVLMFSMEKTISDSAWNTRTLSPVCSKNALYNVTNTCMCKESPGIRRQTLTWSFGSKRISNPGKQSKRWKTFSQTSNSDYNGATIPFYWRTWNGTREVQSCGPYFRNVGNAELVRTWHTEHIFSVGQPKVNKIKIFLPFWKFMKRPQTEFHAHTMRESQVIRSNLSFCQIFLQQSFFSSSIVLLKLQQQILICFCKFSCNSVIIVGLLRLLA